MYEFDRCEGLLAAGSDRKEVKEGYADNVSFREYPKSLKELRKCKDKMRMFEFQLKVGVYVKLPRLWTSVGGYDRDHRCVLVSSSQSTTSNAKKENIPRVMQEKFAMARTRYVNHVSLKRVHTHLRVLSTDTA